jgi:hypothetical protein
MSSDTSPFRPIDPGRVNPMDPVEMDYWCRELGCTPQTLRTGVDLVGEHVAALRDWLERGAPAGG